MTRYLAEEATDLQISSGIPGGASSFVPPNMPLPWAQGVLYSHRANYLHALTCGTVDACCLSSRSVILVIVPLFHANAWGLVFAGPIYGAKLVLPGAEPIPLRSSPSTGLRARFNPCEG